VQFLVFDVTATVVFLLAYLTVVAVQRRRAVPVTTSASLSSEVRPVRSAPGGTTGKVPKQTPATPRPRREWPRLSYPR
jgi:hypothetical protein